MAKNFYFYFGNANPATYSGLSPTFSIFNIGSTHLIPPGITETPHGSGIYGFQCGITQSIAFVIDGGSTLSSGPFRYISGVVDPVFFIDHRIGTSNDSFGFAGADPTTIFGQIKRNQEFKEGNEIFTKATTTLDTYCRGSFVLLSEKLFTNTTTTANAIGTGNTMKPVLILLAEDGTPILTEDGNYILV